MTKLPVNEQDYIKFQVAHNIKLLYKQYNGNRDQNTKHTKNERHTLNNIKEKLVINNAIVLKADKGKSIVISFIDDYHKKVQDFLPNSNFSTVNNDLTRAFQKEIRNMINNCQLTIHKDEKWKYINLNPSAPAIRGLSKVHKIDIPIRPIINCQNAPAYKLAKLLSRLLQIHVPLPYTFNVKNSVHLMNDVLEIPFDLNLPSVSFDKENMYSNVLTNDLIEIIKSMCSKQSHNKKLTNELINITHTILGKTYFKFQDNFYIQKTGLAMGTPTSSILSEIFLQQVEHTATL
jgi:hypothetical protein